MPPSWGRRGSCWTACPAGLLVCREQHLCRGGVGWHLAHTQIPPRPPPTHTQSISPASTRALRGHWVILTSPPREILAGDRRTGANSPEAQGRDSLQHRAPPPCTTTPPPSVCSLTAPNVSSELRDTRVSSPESVPSAQAPSGPALFSKEVAEIAKEKKETRASLQPQGSQGAGIPPPFRCTPCTPHLYRDRKTQLPDTRCKAGQTE